MRRLEQPGSGGRRPLPRALAGVIPTPMGITPTGPRGPDPNDRRLSAVRVRPPASRMAGVAMTPGVLRGVAAGAPVPGALVPGARALVPGARTRVPRGHGRASQAGLTGGRHRCRAPLTGALRARAAGRRAHGWREGRPGRSGPRGAGRAPSAAGRAPSAPGRGLPGAAGFRDRGLPAAVGRRAARGARTRRLRGHPVARPAGRETARRRDGSVDREGPDESGGPYGDG